MRRWRPASRAGLLLHGVTGSGKTEVYLHAIDAALRRGRGAIVLVPEIALTPQMVGRFRARFGERLALLHTALGAGERFDEWARIERGEADLVVGARSAIFAPLRRPRRDRRRRGARARVQAGQPAALPRRRGGAAAGAASTARCCCWAAPRRRWRPTTRRRRARRRAGAVRAARAHRRPPAARGGDRRPARRDR